MRARPVPAPDLRAFVVLVALLDPLLFDVDAHGEGADSVGVPEVVAQIEFGEVEGDAEACEFRAERGAVERHLSAWTGEMVSGEKWCTRGIGHGQIDFFGADAERRYCGLRHDGNAVTMLMQLGLSWSWTDTIGDCKAAVGRGS